MNYKKIILSMTVCAAVLLTGCDRSGKSEISNNINGGEIDNSHAVVVYDEKAELSEIRKNFSNICERMRNNDYGNLNFVNAEFSCPEINEVSELSQKTLSGKSTDEIYDFFSEAVDMLTGNKYTDEEKKYEIRFVDADWRGEGRYPYNCPNIDEYKNGLETDYPWPTIDNENYFIDMLLGSIRGFDNGALMRYDEVDRNSCAMYWMIQGNDKHHTKFYTSDLTRDDKYPLLNGEISIADAAKFAQNYLDNTKFTSYEGNIPKPRIVSANIVDIGKGKYGYDFITVLEYNGVLFDHPDNNGFDLGVIRVETDYDKNSYANFSGHIDMIETNNINHFLSVASCIEITDGDPQTRVITPDSAAASLSEFLSSGMNFSVTQVSMAWLPLSEEDVTKDAPIYPCWKFKMLANGEIYHTFVNMLTGEIYLYIQAVT